jgi:hypothetical protein
MKSWNFDTSKMYAYGHTIDGKTYVMQGKNSGYINSKHLKKLKKQHGVAVLTQK